jgi:nucleotide-binding universal stress UspA family protein
MKTILAPIDFSGTTDAVVASAGDLGRALNATVVLFNVVQPPPMITEYPAGLPDAAEVVAQGEKNADRELAKFADRLKADFIAAEAVHVVGNPIPSIVEQAEAIHADYIVMGSHGHTALYDLLVGSTTHGVLMRAKCPVIIVPAPKPVRAKKSKRAREVMA